MHQIPVRHIKEPDLSGNFTIRDIEDLLAGKDMVQEIHRHDFFLILALKKGSGLHKIDFSPYTITDHTIFLLRPGQVHELVLKAGSSGYIMQFNTNAYKLTGDLLQKASNQVHYALNGAQFNKSISPLSTIFQEQTERPERYQEAILANLHIFFIELIRRQTLNDTGPVGRYRQEQLEKFVTLLEQHIFTHKQVSQYAEMLNLSVYQLNAITKEVLGKTTSELINDQIILESKRCLLATSYQINQIAYHMGYEDPSYFIRFFKKQTGASPDAFRHNFR